MEAMQTEIERQDHELKEEAQKLTKGTDLILKTLETLSKAMYQNWNLQKEIGPNLMFIVDLFLLLPPSYEPKPFFISIHFRANFLKHI